MTKKIYEIIPETEFSFRKPIYYNNNEWVEIEIDFANYDGEFTKGYIKKDEIQYVKFVKYQNGKHKTIIGIPVYRKDGDVMHIDTYIPSSQNSLGLNIYPHINDRIPDEYSKYIEKLVKVKYPELFL